MSLRLLVSSIAKQEGLKKQISVGNIREVIGILSDLLYRHPDLIKALIDNGYRRSKRKK